jgi:urease accessory protein
MPWHARLAIDYRLEAGRTVARHEHSGPLRLLQSLYPEGGAVCHNVLVHPPGGLVGGDTLELQVQVGSGSHALITTPGATRFYRSDGEAALQTTDLVLAPEARLEWLPLEALCYSGCLAENRLTMELQPGAEMLGWDVTALGLPNANQPFIKGRFTQHIEIPGVWLERGHLDAQDHRLMNSPLGLAGNACIASLFFAAGNMLQRSRKEQVLEATRTLLAASPLATTSGVTCPHPQVMVVRVLAPVVEPAMALLRQIRDCWRHEFWQKTTSNPRIWSM